MKRYYITKKQINNFIDENLKNFDSLQTFRNELENVIEELNDGNNPNQIRFYKKVLVELG